ncbi:MAG: hypothetical protein OQL06_13630 [Gammaproteobacteria bacterium]|nr:hypothetical protein [Gammaproteobacteria bacterium]
MFVLYDIEILPEDIANIPPDAIHKMTFKAIYTIKEVPDTFTGVVYQLSSAKNELVLGHFNNPKGNVRKIITLKNKLADGVFYGIKELVFKMSTGDSFAFPLTEEKLKQLIQ